MTALMRIASALLHALLALYPARYRREYGEERACILRLALEEAATGGWPRLLTFCARELRDLPLMLLQEHSKEWRHRMNGIQKSPSLVEDNLSGRQYLLFLIPFLAVLTIPLRTWIGSNYWAIPILVLLISTLILVIAGLTKSLPRWALPSLGLAISIVNLLLLQSVVYATPGLSQLKAFLWRDFIPGRVFYALILDVLSLVPTLLLLVVLALLSNKLPVLSTFRQRLGRDWTLLPFLLYASNLLDPFYADPYRGLEPYQLLFTLILAGGAWFYLQTSRLPHRLIALLVATLLSGLVLALGIYLLYPVQSWVNDTIIDFPRWWEGTMPLLGTLVMMAGIYLMATFGKLLRQGELPKMTTI